MWEHIQEERKKDSPAHYFFSYYIQCDSDDNSEKEVSKKYVTLYPKYW